MLYKKKQVKETIMFPPPKHDKIIFFITLGSCLYCVFFRHEAFVFLQSAIHVPNIFQQLSILY